MKASGRSLPPIGLFACLVQGAPIFCSIKGQIVQRVEDEVLAARMTGGCRGDHLGTAGLITTSSTRSPPLIEHLTMAEGHGHGIIGAAVRTSDSELDPPKGAYRRPIVGIARQGAAQENVQDDPASRRFADGLLVATQLATPMALGAAGFKMREHRSRCREPLARGADQEVPLSASADDQVPRPCPSRSPCRGSAEPVLEQIVGLAQPQDAEDAPTFAARLPSPGCGQPRSVRCCHSRIDRGDAADRRQTPRVAVAEGFRAPRIGRKKASIRLWGRSIPSPTRKLDLPFRAADTRPAPRRSHRLGVTGYGTAARTSLYAIRSLSDLPQNVVLHNGVTAAREAVLIPQARRCASQCAVASGLADRLPRSSIEDSCRCRRPDPSCWTPTLRAGLRRYPGGPICRQNRPRVLRSCKHRRLLE